MNYYTVKEISGLFQMPSRQLYDMMDQIESSTPHRFGRLFRGRHYRGHPKKEKVISIRDVELLKDVFMLMREQVTLDGAICRIFGPVNME